MREEAEDQEIYDSVNIYWSNKQIICSLPLRGKEEEFLSNNREIALKVLNQQCYKYHKDDETSIAQLRLAQRSSAFIQHLFCLRDNQLLLGI